MYFLLITTAVLLFSCSGGEQQKGFIKYEMKTVEKANGDTSSADKGFAKIKFIYPDIQEATNTVVKDILNNYIKNQILTALFEEGRYKQTEFFIENFFKEYKKYYQDLSEAPGFWSLERTVDVSFVNDKIVGFKCFEYSNLGGAHPNLSDFYAVYDLVTGSRLTPKDIFIEGYESKLKLLAEKKFREVRELKPDESFSDAGFNFPGGKFTLNNNFGFTKDGIIFCYNPYELAPHAAGETEVVLPYKDVEGLIKKEFLAP
jgi:hypothetical protein